MKINWSTGNIVGCLLNTTNNTVSYYINGKFLVTIPINTTPSNTLTTPTTANVTSYCPVFHCPAGSGLEFNIGQLPFEYFPDWLKLYDHPTMPTTTSAGINKNSTATANNKSYKQVKYIKLSYSHLSVEELASLDKYIQVSQLVVYSDGGKNMCRHQQVSTNYTENNVVEAGKSVLLPDLPVDGVLRCRSPDEVYSYPCKSPQDYWLVELLPEQQTADNDDLSIIEIDYYNSSDEINNIHKTKGMLIELLDSNHNCLWSKHVTGNKLIESFMITELSTNLFIPIVHATTTATDKSPSVMTSDMTTTDTQSFPVEVIILVEDITIDINNNLIGIKLDIVCSQLSSLDLPTAIKTTTQLLLFNDISIPFSQLEIIITTNDRLQCIVWFSYNSIYLSFLKSSVQFQLCSVTHITCQPFIFQPIQFLDAKLIQIRKKKIENMKTNLPYCCFAMNLSKNRQGKVMRLGNDGVTYYCGLTANIPGTDGYCGPNNGKQCTACLGRYYY